MMLFHELLKIIRIMTSKVKKKSTLEKLWPHFGLRAMCAKPTNATRDRQKAQKGCLKLP